jgi:low affinity Fe/Cu permease
VRRTFADLAYVSSEAVGTPRAFAVAVAVVVVWAATGPVFHFSDTWQLVINTGTTVVTFLMVFLIQATQNRETRALHLKIDELIRSQRNARNIFTGLEHATDDELVELEAEFRKIRARAEVRSAAKGQPDAAEDAARGPGAH